MNKLQNSKLNEIFFSVVITFYNQPLDCLESVRSVKNQTYTNFECIIVDDGSTNNIVDHIKKEVGHDKRFTVISKKHEGVSFTKNKGLSIAQGEYICFLDGDDTLNPDCLKFCNEHIKDNDMIIFGISDLTYSNNKVIKTKTMCPPQNKFENGHDLALWYVKNQQIMLYSCGNKMYKLSKIKENNLSFDNGLSFGEDRIFNYQFLNFAKNIQSFDISLYNYRHICNESLTLKFTSKYIDTVLLLHEKKMKLLVPIADKATKTEIEEFKTYDIRKEVAYAFHHLATHRTKMQKEKWQQEFDYLNTHELPTYFYKQQKPNKNIVDFTNDCIFPKNKHYEYGKYNTVIILGSKKCEYRVKTAYKLFCKNLDAKYICTGGNLSAYKNQNGSYFKEADFMENYLLNKGINKKNIIRENLSTSTYMNIKNSIKNIHVNSKIAIVTAAFHVNRVNKILSKFDVNADIIPAYGPKTKPKNWFLYPDSVMIMFKEINWA